MAQDDREYPNSKEHFGTWGCCCYWGKGFPGSTTVAEHCIQQKLSKFEMSGHSCSHTKDIKYDISVSLA